MFDDPYNPKPKNVLGVGEWLGMLFFLLVCVIIGFAMFRAYVIIPMMEPPQKNPPADSQHK